LEIRAVISVFLNGWFYLLSSLEVFLPDLFLKLIISICQLFNLSVFDLRNLVLLVDLLPSCLKINPEPVQLKKGIFKLADLFVLFGNV